MARRVGSKSRREDRDVAGFLLFWGAAAAILASWLALDPRSIDAFEAPKILLAQIGIAAAAAGALWTRLRRPEPFRIARSGRSRILLALFTAGLLGGAVSATASGHPAGSLDTLRSASIFLLALGAGASLASSKRFSKIEAIFVGAATVNAILVVLAALDLFSPLVVLGQVRRSALGALIGNAGHLGISLALAAVALLPHALSGKFRWPSRAALLVILAGIFATQTLSGLAALAAGAAVYFVLRYGYRGAIPIAAALLMLVIAVGMSRQLRFRVFFAATNLRRGNWNAALSARAAPWLAGTEMVRAHPWLGIGPGNFASEFIPHRIAAEARHHQRLVIGGMANNSFSEAHSDYLEVFAALGIPAGLCIVVAWLLLVSSVIFRGRGDAAAAAAGSSLAAGAVAAATWFPFQIAASGVWLLFLTGASFRFVAPAAGSDQ
jgi:O-antigen ligase